MLRILTVQKLWDFNFLGGLASGLLGGFSIGRYEKKRESFHISPAKLERGAMRFSGENDSGELWVSVFNRGFRFL